MNKTFFALRRKLQKRRREKAKEEYYYSHLYQEQSYPSRVLQFYLTRFFVLGTSFIILLFYSGGERLVAAFLAALALVVIYHLIAKTIEGKMIERIVKKLRNEVREEEFWKRIKTYDKDSFSNFIREVLTKHPQYSEVSLTPDLEYQGINMVAKEKEQWVAIQCHILDDEDMVEARQARELSKAMSARGYSQGIIISTTDFRQATIDFCNLISEKRKINLINKKELFKMAQKAEQLPTETEVNDLILKKIENQHRLWRENQGKIFAKPRALPYFLYGTFLIAMGFIWNGGVPFLYFGSASVLYTLSLLSLIINFTSNPIPFIWKR